MNYYEILEVSKKASDEVIKMAYKALVKKYHPDTFNGDPKIADEKMKEINAAYFILSNPEKRREYDAFLNFQKQHHKQNESASETSSSPNSTVDNISYSINEKINALFSNISISILPLIVIFLVLIAMFVYDLSYSSFDTASVPTPTPTPLPTYNTPNPTLPPHLVPDPNVVIDESDGLSYKEKVELKKRELAQGWYQTYPSTNAQSFSNGQMILTPSEKCVCPLSVSVSGDDAYYIYLESLSGKSDLAFMIKPDSMVEIDVPLGKFEMYYATGKTWYGTALKFGDETQYYKAGTTLDFTKDGQYYYGHEIELWEQYDGNMTEININESDFPG